jgi:Putative porin
MTKTLVWLSALWLLVSTASARDLEDILKEKGILSPVEANEAKAAKEKEQAVTEKGREIEDILKEKGILSPVEANEAKAAKAKEQAATEKAVSAIPSLPEWVKMVTLSGDVRIRNESFFQDGSPDRNRDRFRLRFGFKVTPNDELETGFKLASGNSNDPISNNVTFGDEFTFKDINIANAYIKLTPYKSIGLDRPWVTFMGGKFDVPMYRPPSPNMLVFDKDLTPEGFYESLKVVDAKEGFLRGLSTNFGQWIIQENSKSGEAVTYGFQALGNMMLGAAQFNLAVSDYLYNNPNSIATARNSNTSLNITNFVELSDGEVVGGKPVNPATAGPNKNGMTAPTVDPVTGETIAGQPITITRYIAGFNDVEVAGDLSIPTPMKDWPLRLFGDYVQNTAKNTNGNQGYQGGATIGLSKDPGDLAFSYAYQYLETDAVVSAFSDSDFGHDGGTNTKAHVLQAGYILTKYLSLLSTCWIDKPIDDVSGRNSNTDYRWQVDLLAKF